MGTDSMASKIFLILLPLPLSTSTSLLTCSLPSPSPSIVQLDFTWSVDSRLLWLDPSPLHTESHSASSWEYIPQTGDRVVQCSVAWREKKNQAQLEVKMIEEEVKMTRVEVKVARKANKEDKAMVRLQREGSKEERTGRRRKEKRRRTGPILWIPFHKDRREDLEIGEQGGVEKEEHMEERDIYLYMESQEMWRGGHRRLVQPPGIELPRSLPLTMSSSSSSAFPSFYHVFNLLFLVLIVRNFESC